MDPRFQLVQNDNAGQKNSLSLFEQLLFDYSPRVGGMNNWGRKRDPYGTELPSYLPKPPGNDTRPGNVVPFQRTNMEGPSSGLLAGGVPLPPRRPPGVGLPPGNNFGPTFEDRLRELVRPDGGGADLPTRPGVPPPSRKQL